VRYQSARLLTATESRIGTRKASQITPVIGGGSSSWATPSEKRISKKEQEKGFRKRGVDREKGARISMRPSLRVAAGADWQRILPGEIKNP